MKDEAKEYVETFSPESYYLIVNDLPTLERLKQKLLRVLPKSQQKEKLSELVKYEMEIFQVLQSTPLAQPFAEAVGLKLHHHCQMTEAETATKS